LLSRVAHKTHQSNNCSAQQEIINRNTERIFLVTFINRFDKVSSSKHFKEIESKELLLSARSDNWTELTACKMQINQIQMAMNETT
jgi:hypothetical protein